MMPGLVLFISKGVTKLDIITRNELLIQYEPVVKWAIKHNWTLIQALRLDTNDVYQDLCIAAMKAIDCFDSQKSASLKTHLESRLQYEVKNLKKRYSPHGMTGVRDTDVIFISLDYQPEECRQVEIPVEAPYGLAEFKEALTLLSPDEREVVEEKVQGVYHRKKEQRALLAAAQEKITNYYERSAAVCY